MRGSREVQPRAGASPFRVAQRKFFHDTAPEHAGKTDVFPEQILRYVAGASCLNRLLGHSSSSSCAAPLC